MKIVRTNGLWFIVDLKGKMLVKEGFHDQSEAREAMKSVTKPVQNMNTLSETSSKPAKLVNSLKGKAKR